MGASDFSKLPHIGEAVRRKEDYRFLTGAGQYTDDITFAAQTYAVFVRSPHAHALIKGIDLTRANAMPGVVKIFIGKDLEGKMGGLPCGWLMLMARCTQCRLLSKSATACSAATAPPAWS